MPELNNPISVNAEGTITPDGGTVASPKAAVTVSLPPGAVASTVTLSMRDRTHPELKRAGGSAVKPIVAFDLELKDSLGQKLSSQLQREATIILDLDKVPFSNIVVQSLAFFTLNETSKQWEQVPSEVDVAGKKLTVRTNHFSGWVAGGDVLGNVAPNMEAAQTSVFTRSAEVNIDLKLPPGLSHLVPKLTLRYSSNAVNSLGGTEETGWWSAQASWVGIGWSLDLGHIVARHNDTGSYDMFGIVLNGVADRILQRNDESGTTRWRCQRETFVKINKEMPADRWVAVGKDGTKYFFGQTGGASSGHPDPSNTGSRQDGIYMTGYPPSPRTFSYRWFLDKVEDTHGNVVTINYSGSRAAISGTYFDRSVYPTEMLWNNKNNEPRWKIVFSRQDDRADTLPVEQGVCETGRLDYIDMYVNNSDPYNSTSWERIRRYKFIYDSPVNDSYFWAYQYPPYGGAIRVHLRLQGVQEWSGDLTTSLPPMQFSYRTGTEPEPEAQLPLRLQNGTTPNLGLPYLREYDNGYGGASYSTTKSAGPTWLAQTLSNGMSSALGRFTTGAAIPPATPSSPRNSIRAAVPFSLPMRTRNCLDSGDSIPLQSPK